MYLTMLQCTVKLMSATAAAAFKPVVCFMVRHSLIRKCLYYECYSVMRYYSNCSRHLICYIKIPDRNLQHCCILMTELLINQDYKYVHIIWCAITILISRTIFSRSTNSISAVSDTEGSTLPDYGQLIQMTSSYRPHSVTGRNYIQSSGTASDRTLN